MCKSEVCSRPHRFLDRRVATRCFATSNIQINDVSNVWDTNYSGWLRPF